MYRSTFSEWDGQASCAVGVVTTDYRAPCSYVYSCGLVGKEVGCWCVARVQLYTGDTLPYTLRRKPYVFVEYGEDSSNEGGLWEVQERHHLPQLDLWGMWGGGARCERRHCGSTGEWNEWDSHKVSPARACT